MVLSGTSPAFTKQSRLGFENLEGMSGSSPACPSHLLSLAVIILYYIAFNIFLRYNKATMGEGAQKNKLPPEGRNMTVSKAQQRAVSKYMKENYDVYQIRMPKGKKDDIKEAASAVGESMNQYIINAIDQRMERDSAAPAASEGPEKEDPQA